MKINNMQHFLSKLSVLDNKYRLIDSEKEQFNIFAALHKIRAEVELHSRFLSVLLSPLSSHKRKDLFLSLFLKSVGLDTFDTTSVEVYPTEAGKSEWHNIDILILNRRTKEAVIIENKIDAGDSNHEDRGQLEGYFDKVHTTYGIPKENISVFYLTLDRHEPSVESLGKYKTLEGLNGQLIDYEHEIQDWLSLCVAECVETPYLRESIIQYKNLLKEMTYDDTTIEERKAIKDLIGSSKENLESARLLFNNVKHVKWHTVGDFWSELRSYLIELGYEVTQCPTAKNITDTTHYEPYKKSYNDLNDYGLKFVLKDNVEVFIWNGSEDDWIYWGFTQKMQTAEVNAKLETYSTKNPEQLRKAEGDNPYYWSYFDLSDDENIIFTDFSYEGTFNLINSDYRLNMIKVKLVPQILAFLKELNLS